MKKKWKSLTPPLPKFEKIRGVVWLGGGGGVISTYLWYYQRTCPFHLGGNPVLLKNVSLIFTLKTQYCQKTYPFFWAENPVLSKNISPTFTSEFQYCQETYPFFFGGNPQYCQKTYPLFYAKKPSIDKKRVPQFYRNTKKRIPRMLGVIPSAEIGTTSSGGRGGGG